MSQPTRIFSVSRRKRDDDEDSDDPRYDISLDPVDW